MKKEKKIPTIIGVMFLVVCLIASVYLTQIRTTLGPKASGDCLPVNPQVTNITYNSVDISFTTTNTCLVSLKVNNQNFVDLKSSSRVHYFQVNNLKSTTTYAYSLISGGQTVTNSSYAFRTASKPSSTLPTSNLAWGKVYTSDMKPAPGSIVYLNIPGASPLSSFVTANGNWSISLANSFNDSKSNWFTPPATPADEEIVVISGDGLTTQIANNTAINNPVPDIVIGQNYLSEPKAEPTSSGQIANTTSVPIQKLLSITNPKEGEVLSIARPDFFGVAPINTRVVVEVSSSKPVTGDTTSNSSGSWHWSPLSDLAIGEQTITVKVQNQSSGAWETVSRKFSILLTGNSLGYEASASATIAPTSIPTLVPTAITTVRVAYPSTTSAPPVTGGTLPTILIITSSLIFFFISVKFIK